MSRDEASSSSICAASALFWSDQRQTHARARDATEAVQDVLRSDRAGHVGHDGAHERLERSGARRSPWRGRPRSPRPRSRGTGAGAMFAVTPMSPVAPIARCGSTFASSPEKYSRSVWLSTRLTSLKSPLASLTARMLGCLAARRIVSYLIGHAGAAGDVVQDHRQVGRVGDHAEVREDAGLRRLVVVRRDDHDAVGAGLLAGLVQLDRVRGLVRAAARDDLRAAGRDRLARPRRGLSFSGSVSVLVSPVVPVTTMPSAPAVMTSSMCFSTSGQSTSPSAVNGVTSATRTWPKGFSIVTPLGYRC